MSLLDIYMASGPYFDLDRAFSQMISGPAKTVRHQQTCPECGRTLVNLYEREPRVWLCKRCWDRKGEEAVEL